MSAVLPADRRPPVKTMPVAPAASSVSGQVAAAAKPALAELSAADRLAASRARLRDAMMTISHPPPRAASPMSGLLNKLPKELLSSAKALPGAAIVIEALQAWWAQHPLHTAGTVAEKAARTFVAPMVRRSPFAFVGSAIVVGALLVVSRPWRWLLRPALFVGIVPQLVVQVMKRYPAESLFRVAGSLLSRSSRRPGKTVRATTAAPPL